MAQVRKKLFINKILIKSYYLRFKFGIYFRIILLSFPRKRSEALFPNTYALKEKIFASLCKLKKLQQLKWGKIAPQLSSQFLDLSQGSRQENCFPSVDSNLRYVGDSNWETFFLNSGLPYKLLYVLWSTAVALTKKSDGQHSKVDQFVNTFVSLMLECKTRK